MKNISLFLISCLGFLLLLSCTTKNKNHYRADVIVYGGNSAAIIAAVQVARMGKSVIVVSPEEHLGGLSSSGLGFTDTGNKEVINGLAREFYHRIYLHYQQDSAWKWQKPEEYGNKGQGTPAVDGEERTMWIFEPHVAEQIFEDLVKENHLQVHRNEWLDREKGLVKKNGNITAFRSLSGKTYEGAVFIDATYEGDLMAAAGVKYHVGRESGKVYGEKWNGIQLGVLHHGHHFKTNISAYVQPGVPGSGLLPLISAQSPGLKGDGDQRLQAYCFRLCLSRNPRNRRAFIKPEGYDASRFELLARVYQSGWRETFDKFDPIPNLKTDNNNHGPVSSDYIGMNYEYPEASYDKRKEIIKDHELYQRSLLYFLRNDPKVPVEVRTEMSEWGLAKDEFKDNENWPYQLYIREARRMKGSFVMTEREVMGDRPVPQPIGMGSYTLDSHNAQRYVKPDGFVQNEGDISVDPKKPYQISYQSITPEKGDCNNLLVPVCVSSSHIAFGSIRMEPVFMILGQAAATAAVQAIEQNKAVQDISYPVLKTRLLADHMALSYP